MAAVQSGDNQNATVKLLVQCCAFLVVNASFALLLAANGCGNAIALGTPYGDFQECDSFLQKSFGVDYFSQSSPIMFDSIILIILINVFLFYLFRGRERNWKHTAVIWISIALGTIGPRIFL